MKAVSVSAMRALDRATIESGVKSGFELMNTAASRVAVAVMRHVLRFGSKRILIACGRGNNGGDGFALAGILRKEYGRTPQVVTPFSKSELKGDALYAYESMPSDVINTISGDASILSNAGQSAVIVDAVLGTGFHGEVESPLSEMLDAVNVSGAFIISVDVPSGLNADTGAGSSHCVKAHRTVTFELPKRGLLIGDGPRNCGFLEIVKIGIPRDLTSGIDDGIESMSRFDALSMLPREDFDTWKNRRGHVLVIGGSAQYPSAPFLTAEAAIRNGAGLVTLAIPESSEIVCDVPKSLILRRIPDGGAGSFNERSSDAVNELLKGKTSLVVGMGMDTRSGTVNFLERLVEETRDMPRLFDADALNLFSSRPGLLRFLGGNSILTPHAGEMRRLLSAFGVDDSDMSSVDKALTLSAKTRAVCVMKSVRTAVSSPSGSVSLNLSGSPSLSTAGSGDVLSGTIGSFMCVVSGLYDAARLGVFIHGLNGELHSSRCYWGCYAGVTADDLASTSLSEIVGFMSAD